MSKDRVVLVTGAASGIGLATVEAILQAGGSVVAIDRDAQALERTRALGHERLHCEVADITEHNEIGVAIDRGIAVLAPLNGVVNCAGTGRSLRAFDTEAEMFRQILELNLVSNFIVAREAARRMGDTGGSIVNISSVSALRGDSGRAAYGASKAGIEALTRILAVEWAPRSIRVNAVAPGPIDTPLARSVHSDVVREEWHARVPLARYGTAPEVASVILFLLDQSQSSYVTGQTIPVDGGFTVAGLRPLPELS